MGTPSTLDRTMVYSVLLQLTHAGSIRIQTGTDHTAADVGVYSRCIPDETVSDVDVNIGVYRNGFNSKSVHVPVIFYSIGNIYAHLLALISYLLDV